MRDSNHQTGPVNMTGASVDPSCRLPLILVNGKNAGAESTEIVR